jgi:hypothetical protein
LLSDEGSRVMRELGLINERVQDDHAAYGIKPNPRHVDLPYPGVHVYGQPVDDGLTPLSVEIDAIDGPEVGPARWPAPRRFDLPGFSAGLWVHEGVVRGTVSLTFTGAPGAGDHLLGVTVRYQACDDTSCLVPSLIRLQVPVRETALVGRSLPAPAPKSS